MSPIHIFLVSLIWELAVALEYHWRVVQRVVAPDGYPKLVYVVMDLRYFEIIEYDAYPLGSSERFHTKGAYDQQIYHGDLFPSITLRVKQGERVVIDIENEVPGKEFMIHWHGLDMRSQGYMDGTPGLSACPIAYKTSATVDFNVTNGPGTYWYHSHTAWQHHCGFFGMIVVEEGEGQVDTVRQLYQYADEAEVMLGTIGHESDDQHIAYVDAKVGDYNETVTDVFGNVVSRPATNSVAVPHSFHVAGRGPDIPAACNDISFDEYIYRKYNGDLAGLKNEGNYELYQDGTKSGRHPGLNGGWKFFSVSIPQVPSFWGRCENAKVKPRVFKCTQGRTLLVRVINQFLILPVKFWVDRHHMTIVRSAGVDVVPSTHQMILLPQGSGLDGIIHCDQDPSVLYKMQGMLDVRNQWEQSSIAFEHVTEPGSYAVLDYGVGATRIIEPLWHIRDLSFVNTTQKKSNPTTWRTEGYLNDYQHVLDYNQPLIDILQYSFHSPPTVVTPPAKQRVFFSVAETINPVLGASNPAHSLTNSELLSRQGSQVFVSAMNTGRNYSSVRNNEFPPSGEPLMQGALFGRSAYDVYGTHARKDIPFYQPLRYDPVNPITYEVVMLMFGVFGHPFHFHGQPMQVITLGFFDPVTKWRCKGQAVPDWDHCTGYNPQPMALPDMSLPVAGPKIADVLFMGAMSYTIFRFTADNPGAWLLHCTIQMHLLMGMSSVVDVRATEGPAYPIPPPPDNHTICGAPEATYRNAINGYMKLNEQTTQTSAEAIVQQIVHGDGDDNDKDGLYVVIIILGVIAWNAVLLSGVAVAYAMFVKSKNRKLAKKVSDNYGNQGTVQEEEIAPPVWIPRLTS